MSVTQELQSDLETLPVAEKLLERKGQSAGPGYTLARNQLVICLIGQGKFEQAKKQILGQESEARGLDIYDTFNYAMAEWADTRRVPKDLLEGWSLCTLRRLLHKARIITSASRLPSGR